MFVNTFDYNNLIFFKEKQFPFLDQLLYKYNNSIRQLNNTCYFFNNFLKKYEKKTKKEVKYFKIVHTTMGIRIIGTSRRCALINTYLKKIDITNGYFKYLEDATYVKQSGNNKMILSTELNKLYNVVNNIKISMVNEMTNCFNVFKDEFTHFFDKMSFINNFITKIDVIVCNSLNAVKLNYCTTIEKKKVFVNVTGIRHCLIEKLQKI